VTRDFKRFLFVLLAPLAFALMGGGNAQAASFEVLYSFCADFQDNVCLDGESPGSQLLQIGTEFYGTTNAGTLAKYQYKPGARTGYGNVFKVSADGKFASVYDFCQDTDCSDGARPGNYLVHGKDGLIYGVATAGGKLGAGTVFKLTAQGKLTTIYRFCSKPSCADGIQPVSVIFDANGALFGTTFGGGSHGAGTVFTIDSSGTLRVLHNFCSVGNCLDGVQPGALLLGKDGNFYGTTAAGGKNQAGAVFRMTPTGTFTRLYSLCSEKLCADGDEPTPRLAQGQDGNFYGTTQLGGATRTGVAFRVTPTGTWTVLHSFCVKNYCDDGSTPRDGLTLAKDGSFYGAVNAGGRFYSGLLFHLTAAGDYSIVKQFCARGGCFDGSLPLASPILGDDGLLYGTAAGGGDKDNTGVVYRFTPP
jgi:uncharacterized repeat protein (TIGR03803 family)